MSSSSVVQVWQNERRTLLGGFSSSHLGSGDPPLYCDASGSPREAPGLTPCAPGWRWSGPWYTGAWQYAFSWSSQWNSKRTSICFVRRRLHSRERTRDHNSADQQVVEEKQERSVIVDDMQFEFMDIESVMIMDSNTRLGNALVKWILESHMSYWEEMPIVRLDTHVTQPQHDRVRVVQQVDEKAFEGVKALVIVQQLHTNALQEHQNVIKLAQQCAVEWITLLSFASSSTSSLSDNPIAIDTLELEKCVSSSACKWSIIRVPLLYQSVVPFAASVASQSHFCFPIPNGVSIAAVDENDVVECAVKVTREREHHHSNTYCVYAEVPISGESVCDVLSTVVQKRILFESLSITEFVSTYCSSMTSDERLQLQHLLQMQLTPQQQHVSAVRELLYRSANSFTQFAHDYSQLFRVELIQLLGKDMLTLIFSKLSSPDLLSCANVCRMWRCLAANPVLWKDVRGRYSFWRPRILLSDLLSGNAETADQLRYMLRSDGFCLLSVDDSEAFVPIANAMKETQSLFGSRARTKNKQGWKEGAGYVHVEGHREAMMIRPQSNHVFPFPYPSATKAQEECIHQLYHLMEHRIAPALLSSLALSTLSLPDPLLSLLHPTGVRCGTRAPQAPQAPQAMDQQQLQHHMSDWVHVVFDEEDAHEMCKGDAHVDDDGALVMQYMDEGDEDDVDVDDVVVVVDDDVDDDYVNGKRDVHEYDEHEEEEEEDVKGKRDVEDEEVDEDTTSCDVDDTYEMSHCLLSLMHHYPSTSTQVCSTGVLGSSSDALTVSTECDNSVFTLIPMLGRPRCVIRLRSEVEGEEGQVLQLWRIVRANDILILPQRALERITLTYFPSTPYCITNQPRHSISAVFRVMPHPDALLDALSLRSARVVVNHEQYEAVGGPVRVRQWMQQHNVQDAYALMAALGTPKLDPGVEFVRTVGHRTKAFVKDPEVQRKAKQVLTVAGYILLGILRVLL